MRKSLWVALALVVAYYLAWAAPGAERPAGVTPDAAPAAGAEAPADVASAAADGEWLAPTSDGGNGGASVSTEGPREPTRLTVLSSLGVETRLNIDEQTEVLVVATWCPYTRQTDAVLRDPRGRPYVRGKRLIYLLAWDELDRKANAWVRDGRMTRAQADELIARQPEGRPRLVDPEFVDGAATHRIYYYDSSHPVVTDGFPSAYSGPPNVFRLNYGVWFWRRLEMPRDVWRELFDAHAPGGG